MSCKVHGTKLQTMIKNVNGKMLNIWYCEQCEIDKDNFTAEEKKRADHKYQIETYQIYNIEPMFYEEDFDTFKPITPELEKNLKAVQDLVKNKTGKILMIGKNGTGKNHLAISALKILGGRIYSMYEIATMIRATYTSRSEQNELQLVNKLANYKLLVIDEIGRTKGSDSEENWLSYIIDKRHSRYLPTILISNNHMKKNCVKKGCDKCLENFFSEDVISRVRENGKVINFTGSDYRILKNK